MTNRRPKEDAGPTPVYRDVLAISAARQGVTTHQEHRSRVYLRDLSGKVIHDIIDTEIGVADPWRVKDYKPPGFYRQRELTLRCISNVNASDLVETIYDLVLGEAFLSDTPKAFTTQEALINAQGALYKQACASPDHAGVYGHYSAHPEALYYR